MECIAVWFGLLAVSSLLLVLLLMIMLMSNQSDQAGPTRSELMGQAMDAEGVQEDER